MLTAQCVITCEGERCEFCRRRNFETCVKRWGPKKEELISRQIPTASDAVIEADDALLLQYAYSDSIIPQGGFILSRLLQKFALVFGPSFNVASLRHAALAYVALYAPCHGGFERVIFHSNQASRELLAKQKKGYTEADFFAAAVLTFVNGLTGKRGDVYLHMKTFLVVMKYLVKSKANDKAMLPTLWPIARDIIVEGSRYVSRTSPSFLLEFGRVWRETMGPQSFTLRANYTNQLVEVQTVEGAFAESVWLYCRSLRMCFRSAVSKQTDGDMQRDGHLISTVAELKADLQSIEAREIIGRYTALKFAAETHQPVDWQHNWYMFTLLLYRFCHLLIVLLEGETIVEAASSVEAISFATLVLELVRTLTAATAPYNGHLCQRSDFAIVPRMLWVAGLQFPIGVSPECKPLGLCGWMLIT
jgi:hypothetical protein